MIGPLDGCGLVGCWWLSLIGLQLGCLVAVKATVHPGAMQRGGGPRVWGCLEKGL